MATKIGVRELKNHASRIISEVREEMTEYVITHQNHPVAVLRPFTDRDADRLRREETARGLEALRSVAGRVGSAWTSPKSGLEILDEDRGS